MSRSAQVHFSLDLLRPKLLSHPWPCSKAHYLVDEQSRTSMAQSHTEQLHKRMNNVVALRELEFQP